MLYLIRPTAIKRGGLFSKLFPPALEIKFGRLRGADCCIIEVDRDGRGDWHKICQAVGSGKPVVLPTDMKIPEFIPLCRYRTDVVKRKLIMRSALTVAELASKHGAGLDVMLIDRGAHYYDLLEPLVNCAKTVTVITSETDRYTRLCSRLTGAFGAEPIITDSAQYAKRCDVMIAPDGIFGCGAVAMPAAIFAPSGPDCISVTDSCVDPLEPEWNDRYSTLELLAALISQPGYGGELPRVHSLFVRGETVPVEQMATELTVRSKDRVYR